MRPMTPQKANMLVELDRLEKLMPSYSDLLLDLSSVIRNTIWEASIRPVLAATLYSCNTVFAMLVDVFGESVDLIEMYIDYLDTHSNTYSREDLTRVYDAIRIKAGIYRAQTLVKEQWRQINPYLRKEYSQEELFSTNIIEILDDLFINIIDKYPDAFLLTMKDNRFSHLSRGRRGIWNNLADLCAPSIEVAKKCKIVNRWNPPEKRYLYLSADSADDLSSLTETVFEEMRMRAGENITVASFRYLPSKASARIADFDFDGVNREDIFAEFGIAEQKLVAEIVNKILDDGVAPTDDYIQDQIKLQDEATTKTNSIFAGKLFLKEICEAIFIPLDTDEDNDSVQRDKCYKAFHILAEYLESKGYSGISFPSTRMRLIGKRGSNLVLFDADSAEPILTTYMHLVR